MEYLKKYNITDNEILNIKERYNSGIINFFEKNKEYIEEKINYLQQEKFVLLYEIIYNNVKIFLESTYIIKEKIEIMKKQNLSQKAMNMILIEEDLYDKIK